jgi:recombination protein RecA
MAKKATEVNTAPDIEAALKALRKQFGDDAAMTFEDDRNKDIEFISTGSLGLDLALGGGIALGRIVEIYGPESSGKSTICLQICAEAQKKGYRVAYIDLENALDTSYMRALGCDLKNMIISQPESGEQAFQIAETLIKNKYVNIVVFDSVSSMLTQAEINGEVGDSFIGVQARLMSAGLKKITPLAAKANCACVFVNQIRNKIGVMFGNPETTSGGEALKFYASQRMRISRTTAPIKDGEEAIGNETKVKVIKNKVFPPFREAAFKIIYGEGVSRIGEILTFAVQYGFIDKAGAFYKYQGNTVGQGEMKTLNWLKENPEIQEYLLEQIKNRALNSDDTTLVTEEENVDVDEEFVEEMENSEIEMENPADTIE